MPVTNKQVLRPMTILAAAAIASSAAAQFSIPPAVNYATGLRPSGVAIGDFNGDGFMDIATSTDTPDKINILLNDGTGSFVAGPVIQMPSSSSPDDLQAGDLDGDGDDDIAVILRDLLQVRIALNNGGSFTLGSSAPIGVNAQGMDIDDIDGDGDLDLGVANRDSNTATVMYNNGAAVFTSVTVPQPPGSEPRSVAFGSFAGSGPLSLAVGNHDTRMVNVFTQSGGSFIPAASLFVGGNDRPDGMTAVDLNNDGRDDIATVSGDDTPSQNRVVVFYANSATSFTGPQYASTGLVVNSSDIVAADLDCDNLLDLVVSNQDSNNISLLRNLGGSFGAPTLMVAGTRPGRLNAADLDNDGDPDFAVANRDSNNISVYTNDTCEPTGPVCGNGICEAGENNANCPGDCPPIGPVCGNGICEIGETSATCPADCGGGVPPGTFAFAGASYPAGVEPSGVATGDFNNDGHADLAVTADLNANADNVAILFGSGTGTFAAPIYVNLPNSSSPEGVVAGDLDGDGDIDLAVGLKDNNAVIAVLNGGTGNFTLGAAALTGAEPRGMSIADASGDGDLDMVVANRTGNSVTILLNNGNATFAATTIPVGLEPRDAAWGDFDGDGDQDIIVSNHDDRTISVLTNQGRTFSAGMTLSVGPQDRPDGLIAADLNGDHLADIAAASGDDTAAFNRAIVFLSTGAGFTGPAFFATGPGALNTSDITAADLDCDGDLDLALSNRDSNNVSVLANNGSGIFGAAVVVPVGTAPEQLIAADLDGDGAPDLVSANRNSNNVSVLLNTGCTPPNVPGDATGDGLVNVNDLLAVINAWGTCPGCAADLNNDGAVDVVDLLLVINNWTA